MLTILRNRHRRGYTRGPLSLFTFWVPCCDVRYDFRIRTKFCSSLLPVVCRRTHVLLTLFVFASGFGWFSRCCCFISLHLVYPMLSVSLDCPFLIATSGLSKVYLKKSSSATSVHSKVYSILLYVINLCLVGGFHNVSPVPTSSRHYININSTGSMRIT
jgi:hypothetical protein